MKGLRGRGAAHHDERHEQRGERGQREQREQRSQRGWRERVAAPVPLAGAMPGNVADRLRVGALGHAAHARWAAPLLLAGAVLLGLFFNLGGFPLFDVDEGAFSEATREMLARGDWVSTWLNGQPRFDKPILTYWLQAASVGALGLNELALRLPSALAAAGWIAAILVFARRFLDRGTAWAAAFIAATAAGVVVIGRGAIADALLNLFLALAMFDIYRALAAADPSAAAACRRRAFVWIGFGLLTKGPVALLVPAGASFIACVLQRRGGAWWRAALDPVGWALMLVVALPWYCLEYLRRGDAFVAGFFMRHNVERFLVPLQGHGGGLLYYVPALLLVLLPYTGLLLAALPGLRRQRADPLDGFLWCWFLFVFGFFSLAGTKLPHYLLYGVTPLFILMARRRHALRSRVLALLPPVVLLAAIAALPALLQRVAPGVRNPYLREALGRPDIFGDMWQATAAVLLASVLVAMVWPRRRRTAPEAGPHGRRDTAADADGASGVWPRLAFSGLLCSFALAGLLLPAWAELQQGPVKRAALAARHAGLQVHSWRINVPSFSVYRGAVTPAAQAPRPGDVLLTRSDALDGLGPVRVLFREGGVLLVRVGG